MAASELNRTQERKANTSNGGMMLLLTLLVLIALIYFVVELISNESALGGVGTIALAFLFVLQL
jgi:uncharacterized membrane protein